MFGDTNLTKVQLLEGVEGVTRSKKVARNTVQYWLADGTECIKYHDTVVVSKAPDGVITLNSGGFRTMTTKDRIWEYGHVTITQRGGIWYMPNGSAFYDGIRVRIEPAKEGEYPGRGAVKIVSDVREVDESKVRTMKARIKKYCDLITPENLPHPKAGDCWYCCMHDITTDKPLGDITGHPHLITHMQERSVNSSLIVNAMQESGFSNEQITAYYFNARTVAGMCLQTIRKAVSKYLQRRLLPGVSVR